MWRGAKPGDFELRLDFRWKVLAATPGSNFAAANWPNWDTSGYQADIEYGDQWTAVFLSILVAVWPCGVEKVCDRQGRKEIGPPRWLRRRKCRG